MDKLKLIAVVSDPESRRIGLSRSDLAKSLPKGYAMLFDFGRPVDPEFWNKGVNYPIDVAFYDENKLLLEVVQLQKQQESTVYCATGHPQYALETNIGWFEKNQIPIGTPLEDILQ